MSHSGMVSWKDDSALDGMQAASETPILPHKACNAVEKPDQMYMASLLTDIAAECNGHQGPYQYYPRL